MLNMPIISGIKNAYGIGQTYTPPLRGGSPTSVVAGAALGSTVGDDVYNSVRDELFGRRSK